MARNQYKTLKAKFDKFSVGYGPVCSVILGALRTTLFGEMTIEEVSARERKKWGDLFLADLHKIAKEEIESYKCYHKLFKGSISARKRASVARTQHKAHKTLSKRKKASK